MPNDDGMCNVGGLSLKCWGMKRLLLLLSFRGLHSSGMSSVRAWSHAQLSMCVGAQIFVFFFSSLIP